MVYERKITALCEGFGRLANVEKCLREYVTYFGDIRNPERDAARRNSLKRWTISRLFCAEPDFFSGRLGRANYESKE
jgi:hypothetical protein